MPAYLPIALFAVDASGFAGAGRLAGSSSRPTGRDQEGKLEPYECGVEPVRDARQRFSVRFYIVAMLFLIFDVETIFLFPWAVQFRQLALFGFIAMDCHR